MSLGSRTDLIHLLATSLSASHASPHGRTSEAYLATDLVHHVPTRLKDYGWGCGCVESFYVAEFALYRGRKAESR